MKRMFVQLKAVSPVSALNLGLERTLCGLATEGLIFTVQPGLLKALLRHCRPIRVLCVKECC